MTSSRPRTLALAVGIALVAAALAGCSAPAAPGGATSTPPPPASTPAATSDAYAIFCEANRTAAAAKAGTVGEDLEAVTAQASAIRALLPLSDVSAQVAAGAEVFATSAEETAAIPADSLVSDVGLDPRFTESDAVRRAATDPDYQAFIAWTIETCDLAGG
jgi:hypothetical protein